MAGKTPERVSRWHWLWLAPVGLAVLVVTEGHTLPYGFQVVRLAWRRWTWAALLSPSAYFCWSVVIASVAVPVQGLMAAIVRLFSPGSARRRYLGLVLILAAVLVLPFVTDALIWGSFPFSFDQAGIGRLRLIPFIPWPSAPFGTY